MAEDGFITDLKRKFQQGDIVLRLVYVNVAVFLVVTLVQIFLTLFNGNRTSYPALSFYQSFHHFFLQAAESSLFSKIPVDTAQFLW